MFLSYRKYDPEYSSRIRILGVKKHRIRNTALDIGKVLIRYRYNGIYQSTNQYTHGIEKKSNSIFTGASLIGFQSSPTKSLVWTMLESNKGYLVAQSDEGTLANVLSTYRGTVLLLRTVWRYNQWCGIGTGGIATFILGGAGAGMLPGSGYGSGSNIKWNTKVKKVKTKLKMGGKLWEIWLLLKVQKQDFKRKIVKL